MRNRDPSPRMAGRKLQARRLRIWSNDPHCAHCRDLVRYPDGFELDHKQALIHGGDDTDDNCQVLCLPCHVNKSAEDMGEHRGVTAYAADGLPVDPGHPWRKALGPKLEGSKGSAKA